MTKPSSAFRELSDDDPSIDVVTDGNLKFVRGHRFNTARPTYQEASGAPLEERSPLGSELGTFTFIWLEAGAMVGTGVYSTRMFESKYPPIQGALQFPNHSYIF